MHISDGVLPTSVAIGGYAASAVLVFWSARRSRHRDLPKLAVMTAAFFVASLVHIPFGPTSVHLILPGLTGALLGPSAFLSIGLGLLLQSLLFQFGGITALGVNTVIMALPAVICYLMFSPLLHKNSTLALLASFACGFLAVLLSAIILGLALLFTEENFLEVSAIVIAAHIPVMIIEGFITAICVSFIRRVQPAMLPGSS